MSCKVRIVSAMVFMLALMGFNIAQAGDEDLVWSTFLGGDLNSDRGYGIAVDMAGYTYVTGGSASDDFPTTPGAYDETYNNYLDVVVTKFNLTGSALVYATFIGGIDHECGQAIAVDGSGNAYVTGYTMGADFPTTAGAFDTTYNSDYQKDVFVAKLNPTGSELGYATFLGGFDDESGNAIEVNEYGNAYVTGYTESWDFPTTPGAYDETWNANWDAFVAKFTSAGSALEYSTFLGGWQPDEGKGLDIDGSSNAYVTGITDSPDFPTTPGAFDTSYNQYIQYYGDVFITKLNATGNALTYSTFLGGINHDFGCALSLDGSGSAYVTGYTESGDFPVTAWAYDTTFNGVLGHGDAFVVKLNLGGSDLDYATFLGGQEIDEGRGIVVDNSGRAYVTGYTKSSNFPKAGAAFDLSFNGGESDAFMTRLSPSGNALSYSTYLGGGASDIAYAIVLEEDDKAYLVGTTWSSDFPTTPGAYDTTKPDNYGEDIFVTKFQIEWAPQVTVIYPNGGEVLTYSTTITWSAIDPDPGETALLDINLEYSSNGGGSWNPIAGDETNDGSYLWDVSGLSDGTDYLVRATATDPTMRSDVDQSDSTFTIDNPDSPNVTVTYPNGGEILSSPASITWMATDPDSGETALLDIDLEYSANAGGSWSIIDSNHTNDGAYLWDISGLPEGDSYLIRITATDPLGLSATDSSDAVFTIPPDRWTQMFPPTSPSARNSHDMAPLDGSQVLLFGGYDGALDGETWVYDLSVNTWTKMLPMASPSARINHGLASLPGDQVLLFGGNDGTYDDETRVYDLSVNTWTKMLPPASPSARYGHDLATLGGDQVLLFGGHDGALNGETWVYDLGVNTWTQMFPPASPSPRRYHRMDWIGSDQVLLFGGLPSDGRNAETWVYDLSQNTWTQMFPPASPSARYFHAMASLGDGQALLFGGDDGTYDGETWVYDVGENIWIQQSSITSPLARSHHAMAYISGYQMLLFGGYDGANDDETWVYTGSDKTSPEAIVDLSAALENGAKSTTGNIYLWWSEPDDDVGVDRYVVYRSTAPSSLGDSLDGTTDTTYTDMGAAGDTLTNYFYAVKAVDAAGNKSDQSNQVGEFDRGLLTGTKAIAAPQGGELR